MITTTLNPAVGLTANKVPYALGNGRFADSGITFDPAANGNVTVVPNGTGSVVMNASGGRLLVQDMLNTSTSQLQLGSWNNGYYRLGRDNAVTGYFQLRDTSGSLLLAVVPTNGRALFGGLATDYVNGGVQLSSHSALTGGYAFGSAADGTETIWRSGAGSLRTGGAFRVGSLTVDSGFAMAAPLVLGGVTRIAATQPDYSVNIGGMGASRDFNTYAPTDFSCWAAIQRITQDLIDVGIFQ